MIQSRLFLHLRREVFNLINNKLLQKYIKIKILKFII